MFTDPIADLLTRLRNGQRAHHQSVSIPYSRFKESLLKVIKNRGFIEDYRVAGDTAKEKELTVMLKEGNTGLVLKRVSKPGQRIYIKGADLKLVKNGLGILVLSTSKGLMTNHEAKKMNLGGEIICEIY